MEKVVTWAISKAVEEEIDNSVTTAALLGVALDSAAFKTAGMSATGAAVAGAATGAGLNIYRKIKKGSAS